MIVLTVTAILASVAYPSYRHQVVKGRRADGQQALWALAGKLERFRNERGSYAGAALGPGGLYPRVSAGGHYTLAIASQSEEGFTISAAPGGQQLGDACGTLVYNQFGDRSVGPDATAGAATCW
jgi:type IV pilus assembly protein PilE